MIEVLKSELLQILTTSLPPPLNEPSAGEPLVILIVGVNGNGKTTFAKLLANTLAPLAGEVIHHPKLNVGYFHQHQVDMLDLEISAYEQLAKHMPRAKPEALYTHLGCFGLGQDMAKVKVGNLSGGEKARLNFSLISCETPNILILDEPTNHLDMASRENLIIALNDFKGAVILITHDRYLLEHTVDLYWLVADQQVTPFDGTLEDYYAGILGRKLKSSRAEEIREKKKTKKLQKKKEVKKHRKKKGRGDGFVMD